jgi:hypothetical protein
LADREEGCAWRGIQTNDTAIRQEQAELKLEASRIADAIAKLGDSATLIARMQATESRILTLGQQLERVTSAVREPSYDNMRAFVLKMLSALPELVERDPERARAAALSRHLPSIVLTPSNRDGSPVFDVSGSWKLVPVGDAMQVVARDGIEPPTPDLAQRDFAPVGQNSSLALCLWTRLYLSSRRKRQVPTVRNRPVSMIKAPKGRINSE